MTDTYKELLNYTRVGPPPDESILTPFEDGQLTTKLFERPNPVNSDETDLVLEVHASGLTDRSDVYAWSFPKSQRKLAERLKRCVDDNKAFKGYEILTDINGKTYISATQNGRLRRQYMSRTLMMFGY